MKTNIDFTTEIPCHEFPDSTIEVSITNYADGPRMSIKTPDQQRITLTREEIEELRGLFIRYVHAQAVLEGKTA